MKKVLLLIAMVWACLNAQAQQTMWVCTGDVKWAYNTTQVDTMRYANATSLTILGKTFAIADIDSIYVDDNAFDDDNIDVTYNGSYAKVIVAGNIASHITANVNGAHVTMLQDASVESEYTYTLHGASSAGSFYMDGSYKMSLVLNGLNLTNPDSAAINIRDGKRISVEMPSGTVNTLVDGTGGSQKACFAIKGHTELKGAGTLNISGNTAHAFWSKEYVEVKKTAGNINILKAIGDGFNVNQYFQQNGGNITISGVSDDGIQVSYETDDNDVIVEEAENTGTVTIKGGTLNITTTGSGVKGIKAANNVDISGGTVTITQTGGLDTSGDLSYSTGIKADNDVNITGGSIIINNTANGGKGISADGEINIDESNASTSINITANGIGGTAEATGGSTSTEDPKSYKVYVSIPTSGSGGYAPPGSSSAWSKVYLYKSDGTLVQQLTSTVTRSNGASTLTFYYYDFHEAVDGNYYFKSDNYTSHGQTYVIRSTEFSAPTNGSDIYFSITNSYQTSGSTRTYSLTNVTASYGGSSDVGEDSGTSYNAAGLKADGNLNIAGGTIVVKNSGSMSKSIKSKATVTIDGGNITLTPSGSMMVINNDASYSSGIKTFNYVQNGGTVTINTSGTAGKGISATNDLTVNDGELNVTNTGAGQGSGNARYTAKGLKADVNMTLAGGNITVATTQAGAKGIKVNGNYVQGKSDGTGPTLTVSTQGGRYGASGSSWGGMGGKTTGQGGAAKAIKAMGTIVVYGGTTALTTQQDGGEGIESRTSIDIRGGQHYYKTYDDCMSCSGSITFSGGATVAYSFGNDAVDANYNSAGAITIGNGAVLAYSTKGGAEEGLDCDNNSNIRITGTGYAISAGGSQGGGGGWGGSGNTISGAAQGYAFYTSSMSLNSSNYYSLCNSSGTSLVVFKLEGNVSSNLALFTAKGMVKGTTYYVRTCSQPTNATTAYHGLYLGGSTTVNSSTVCSFTAQ